MDVEYTWMLRQEKICGQFRLQYPHALNGWDVYPVGGKGRE